MTAVIQRVSCASVISDGVPTGEIGAGLMLLLGVKKGDSENDALLLADKIAKLRIFSDENGKMNLSVIDVKGQALVVSNFTLNANYSHGNRPDYLDACPPDEATSRYAQIMRTETAPTTWRLKSLRARQSFTNISFLL